MATGTNDLHLEQCFQPVDQLAVEKTEEELLVLMLQSGDYFGLGKVGSFIWERLDGKRSLTDVAMEIARAFAIDLPQAQEDLLEFTKELLEAGLIEQAS